MKSRRPVNSDVMPYHLTSADQMTHHTSCRLFLALLFVMGGAVLAVHAQCDTLDKTKSAFFLTYEGIVTVTDADAPEGKRYRTQALFRLHNNSACSIIVPTQNEGSPFHRSPFLVANAGFDALTLWPTVRKSRWFTNSITSAVLTAPYPSPMVA